MTCPFKIAAQYDYKFFKMKLAIRTRQDRKQHILFYFVPDCQVLFATYNYFSNNVAQDQSGVVVKHFLAIAKNYSPQQTEHILMEWYKATEKDFDAFTKKYPAAA